MTAALAGIFLAYTVASSLSIYPHSLSYFNELAAVLPTPADASYPKPYDEAESISVFGQTSRTHLPLGLAMGPATCLTATSIGDRIYTTWKIGTCLTRRHGR